MWSKAMSTGGGRLLLAAGALTGVSAAALVLGLSGGSDAQCKGPGYEDFQAHLTSRGAVATCAHYKSTVAAGAAASAASEIEGQQDYEGDGAEASSAGSASVQLVQVPDVVGLTGAQSTRALTSAGLRASTFVSANGIVTRQVPEPGRAVRAGSGVTLMYVDSSHGTAGGYNYGGSNSSNQGTAGGYNYGGSNSSNQGTAGGYSYGGG